MSTVSVSTVQVPLHVNTSISQLDPMVWEPRDFLTKYSIFIWKRQHVFKNLRNTNSYYFYHILEIEHLRLIIISLIRKMKEIWIMMSSWKNLKIFRSKKECPIFLTRDKRQNETMDEYITDLRVPRTNSTT